jgi:hypothetical protein
VLVHSFQWVNVDPAVGKFAHTAKKQESNQSLWLILQLFIGWASSDWSPYQQVEHAEL